MEPETSGDIRNSDGTFKPGVSGNPAGRPKGTSIKDLVRKWLDEHPEDKDAFVAHFIKENRELAWQMLEGRPHQATDLTSGGKPIPILNVVPVHDSDSQDPEAK